MPTAIKRKPARRPTLRELSHEVERLRARVKELEDLRDLNAAIARNQGKPGVPWDKAKAALGVG
jgi:cell division protein FtsB